MYKVFIDLEHLQTVTGSVPVTRESQHSGVKVAVWLSGWTCGSDPGQARRRGSGGFAFGDDGDGVSQLHVLVHTRR
jgi:hypothetical protein